MHANVHYMEQKKTIFFRHSVVEIFFLTLSYFIVSFWLEIIYAAKTHNHNYQSCHSHV